MKTYTIEFTTSEKSHVASQYYAHSKPHLDVLHILKQKGVEEITVRTLHNPLNKKNLFSGIIFRISSIYILLQIVFKFRKIRNSQIIIQYPFYGIGGYLWKVLHHITKNNKIIWFIHDIDALRGGNNIENEINIFNQGDAIIVHSSKMKEELNRNELNKRIEILEFFDYLHEDFENPDVSTFPIKLIYAGNLGKSEFLNSIDNVAFNENFQLNLYGVNCPQLPKDTFIHYKGKFKPNNIEEMHGNWGLVWDGNSCNTCQGHMGEYLRYNAPHKLSLYLAAEVPVVVWKDSAMAEYVKKYNIGITVDSLHSIEQTISNMTEEERNTIKQNAKLIGQQIRKGEKLSAVLVGFDLK